MGGEGDWKASSGRSVVTLEQEKKGSGDAAGSVSLEVHFGDLEVYGGHIAATVKKSLIRERFIFESCYADAEPNRQGRGVLLAVEMFVHADGHVSELKVSGPEKMTGCITELLAQSTSMPNGAERSRVLFRVLIQPTSAGDDTRDLGEPF